MPTLPYDDQFDALILIPTCAEPDILVGPFRRLARTLARDHERAHVVLCVNPVDRDGADEAVDLCRAAWRASGAESEGSRLSVHREPGPVGFARAVNLALQVGVRAGLPELTVLLNDDVDVTDGWLGGLHAALGTRTVRCWSEIAGADGDRPQRDATAYGRIGLVGPAVHYCAGMQNVDLDRESVEAVGSDLDGFAARFREEMAGRVYTADFLSGCCLAVRREALVDLVAWVPDDGEPRPMPPDRDEYVGDGTPLRPCLLDERYGVGGYEDNDLCVRAELAGWRCAIAGEVFVRHEASRTSDRHFKSIRRGMSNRVMYYSKWAQDQRVTGKRLVAVYRVKLSFAQDLHFLRSSLHRVATVADGVAVLLTANPLSVREAHDWGPEAQASLRPEDVAWLNACSGADAATVADATRRWVEVTCSAPKCARPVDVACDVWTGEWNERDERNAAIALGESLGADWLLSVDADEVLEDRITRAHVERYMGHPDPLVRAWDVGWITHWDTPRLQRVDPPWADGPRYASEMHGFRLWRVCRAAPRRIIYGTANGLHCGNSPDHDLTAKRVSGLRWRHMGMLRAGDREAKVRRYDALDPEPDWRLTGNPLGYTHLIQEDCMTVSPFVPRNGIGIYMLVHAGEDWHDLGRWLNDLHGVADRIVFVWTDPWGVDHGGTDADGAADATGPGPELRALADLHGVRWVHHRLRGDLSAPRNAGLDALRDDDRLGWGLALDPDEWSEQPFEFAVALRRMAEASDSWAFMFEFLNDRADGGPPTVSENLRMTRLDPAGVMRWSGRIHEGFGEAIDALRSRRVALQARYCPWKLHNRGLSGDDDALQRKVTRYAELLCEELRQDPSNSGAWVSLGLQYANDGRFDLAETCLQRGVCVAGPAYLAYKELALLHLRRAGSLLLGAQGRLSTGHPWRKVCDAMVDWLRFHAPPQPLVGHARSGRPRVDLLPPLPDFPDDLVPPPGSDGMERPRRPGLSGPTEESQLGDGATGVDLVVAGEAPDAADGGDARPPDDVG